MTSNTGPGTLSVVTQNIQSSSSRFQNIQDHCPEECGPNNSLDTVLDPKAPRPLVKDPSFTQEG